jgi:glucose/arabinose dehydrogenase
MHISMRFMIAALSATVLAPGLTGSGRADAQAPGQWVVPAGFEVTVFADSARNARSMALGPGGTVFVGSRTAGKVHAVVDRYGDHRADRVVLIASGLDQPNGIAVRNGALYVATASRLLRYDTTEPPVRTLGAHAAALGFTFYTGSMFPTRYRNAVIVAEHGSRPRSVPSGHRVMAAQTDGRRVTSYEPLIQGFLPSAAATAEGGRGATRAATGRPVDVLQLPDGSVLISDDAGNRLLRLSYRQ